MTLTVIIIHIVCLCELLYLTTILFFSKKSSLQTLFFNINQNFNVVVCIFTTMIIADFMMAEGYLACPNVVLFTIFKYVMNTIVTAICVAMFHMVYLRYRIVTSAYKTHTKKCALLKFFAVLWTISTCVALPVLFVEFRYDETIKYYVSDPKSRPFLIFDIMEGLCSSTFFVLSLYYTAKTVWFMRVHNKPWNMFLLHILLTTGYPIVLIPFQWLRVYWRLFDCELCSVYAKTLRPFASPATLIVAFSIVICSTDVREEVMYSLSIFRKLRAYRLRMTGKLSAQTTVLRSSQFVVSQVKITG